MQPPADAHLDIESGLTEFETRLNDQISASLQRIFPAARPSEAHVEDVRQQFSSDGRAEPRRTEPAGRSVIAGQASGLPRRQIMAALAASVAIVAISLAWFFGSGEGGSDPHFQQDRVAVLHQRMIDRGFEPYYQCDDDERFRQVFSTRQDVELSLDEMPEGARMLGLSYPGGLSRDTTAMLCIVDDQPVTVFVDRVSSDSDDVSSTGDDGLFVHRTERDGLVFYEVSPFDSPQVTRYMIRPVDSGRPGL